jgi:predicted phage terminase large subunit-like protein
MQIKEWIKADVLRVKQQVHPWYKPAPFHKEIAKVMMDKSKKRVIITVGPQHGKTELLSRTMPAYFLANNPDESVVLASYNETYANKISVKCRDFFLDPKFQELYPFKLHPELSTKHEWALALPYRGSAVFSGGTITGNPASLILIDDLTKDLADAMSKVRQDEIKDWFNDVVMNRLQGEDSRIIILSTRWIQNDLIGHLLKRDKELNIPEKDRWEVINFKSIINIKDKKDISTGESLWPEKKSMKFLMDLYRKNPARFMALHQGEPKDLESCVINEGWIKTEQDIKSLGEIAFSIRGWDWGYSKTGNWTRGSKLNFYELGETYVPILADVVGFREDPSITKEKVIETAQADGKDVVIGMEIGGTQAGMTDNISADKRLLQYTIENYLPKGDKVARAMPWILQIENGHFRFLPGAWNAEVKEEMKNFSRTCEKDDIEDSISTAWNCTSIYYL